MAFIDLSHMLGGPQASYLPEFETPSGKRTVGYIVKPFLSHKDSARHYRGKASFEISEVSFQTSISTYLDAPAHRYEGRADISAYTLDDLILRGWKIDVAGFAPGKAVEARDIAWPDVASGDAVLFHFGWDKFWGDGTYHSFPFLAASALDRICALGVRLVGVDTQNVDCPTDYSRPAHTRLLKKSIAIVENLRGLDRLPDFRPFRFYAITQKAYGAVAFPVRAFAEVPT